MKTLFVIFFLVLSSIAEAQQFDPVSADETLLKELIIEKINAKRAKRKMKPITSDLALQQTSEEYIARYRYKKFESNSYNKQFIQKKIRKKCVINGYKNGFLDFQITTQNAMNYYGTSFYYDENDTESTTHLFLGNKPSKSEKEDPGFNPVYMKMYTYDELANFILRHFIKDDGYFTNLNNGYDKYGFSLTVDKKTVFRNRIPKIKAILILGGNRITW